MADETPPLDEARMKERRLESIRLLWQSIAADATDASVLEAGIRHTYEVMAEVDRLRAREAAAMAIVRDVAGDHEHVWEAVDPQEVWACAKCHEASQDYALGVQTRARALLAQE